MDNLSLLMISRVNDWSDMGTIELFVARRKLIEFMLDAIELRHWLKILSRVNSFSTHTLTTHTQRDEI